MSRARLGKRPGRRGLALGAALAALGAMLIIGPAVALFPAVLRHRTESPERWAMLEVRAREAERAQVAWSPRFEWVPLSEVSPYVVQAVLTAEDSRFHAHEGFDWDLLVRAAETGDTRATSTITQQTVKNLYLSPRQTLLRKLREAVLTWWMELWLPKGRILELYLNVAELGPGIFGVEAASRFYFDRSASELTAAQAALLAATLPSPLAAHPAAPSPRLEERQRAILTRMGYYYERQDVLVGE